VPQPIPFSTNLQVDRTIDMTSVSLYAGAALRRSTAVLLACSLVGCTSHQAATAFHQNDLRPSPQSAEALEGSSSAVPPFDATALEQRIQDLINEVRLEHGLAPLAWNEKLAYAARLHSRDMADHDFFDHKNRQGETASERGTRVGYACKRQVDGVLYVGIGENLYYTYRYDTLKLIREGSMTRQEYDWKTLDMLAREAIAGWLNSPPHRANLLSRVYHTQGVGVALSAGQQLYVTQNLC
jgi:uncharacterized protein YkwD